MTGRVHLPRPANLAVNGNTACGRTVRVDQIRAKENGALLTCPSCKMFAEVQAELLDAKGEPAVARLWRRTYTREFFDVPISAPAPQR